MTALVPHKWSFSTKKPHVWSATLFQGTAGPEQHMIHGQDPEGQCRSDLAQIPQFLGLGRAGGAGLELEGSQGPAGQFHPTQAGEVAGTAREEPPARLPHSG